MKPHVYATYTLHTKDARPTKRAAEHFIIPASGGRYMIYAPLRGVCAHVNKAFIDSIGSGDPLVNELFDFINKAPEVRMNRKKRFLGVSLSLTSDCNLRCKYCYVSGGSDPRYMPWETAKAAIDWTLKRSGKRFRLFLQGEGEPTLAFPMLKRCYEYTKSRCDELGKELFVMLTTNGVFGPAVLEWIRSVPNIDVSISFDGPPSVQNNQRPLKNGGPSWPIVYNTIKTLQKAGTPFTVKTTVVSGGDMKKLLRYFHKIGVRDLQLGGLLEQGRCVESGIHKMEKEKFFSECVNTYELSKKLGMNIPQIISLSVTGSCDMCSMLNVTTDGMITSCLDVVSPKDLATKIFMYGRIENDRAIVQNKKLEYLRGRTVDKIDECSSCFAKWNCAGGCATKAYRINGSVFLPDISKCDFIKRSLTYMLDKGLRIEAEKN